MELHKMYGTRKIDSLGYHAVYGHPHIPTAENCSVYSVHKAPVSRAVMAKSKIHPCSNMRDAHRAWGNDADRPPCCL